jgi:hypothetical protein
LHFKDASPPRDLLHFHFHVVIVQLEEMPGRIVIRQSPLYQALRILSKQRCP